LFDGDGVNLFAYVLADPINRVDESGEGFIDCGNAIKNYVKCKSGGPRSVDERKKTNECKGPDKGHDNAIEEKNNRCERLKATMIRACKDPAVYGPVLIVGAVAIGVALATGTGEAAAVAVLATL